MGMKKYKRLKCYKFHEINDLNVTKKKEDISVRNK
jgi:hypothetical protein